MKSPAELAAEFWSSPEEQKRQAVALRRLSGGVRAALDRKDTTGLSDKEVRTLCDAVAVLTALADNHLKAEKLTKKKQDARAEAEVQVRHAMLDNFDSLSSVQDRIALIAAVRSYLLRQGLVLTPDDLHFYFKECLDSLAYEFSTKVAGGSPQNLVDDAWNKFESHRAELQDKHAQYIIDLTRAGERAQELKSRPDR